MSGISPRLVDQRGDSLIAAVDRGLAVPDKELPKFPRGERRTPDPSFETRVEKLKLVRNKAAEQLGLDPGVLAPKGTLEAVARANPKDARQLAAVADVRKWQVEVLGKDFLSALSN
jgi:ribonuclease D